MTLNKAITVYRGYIYKIGPLVYNVDISYHHYFYAFKNNIGMFGWNHMPTMVLFFIVTVIKS